MTSPAHAVDLRSAAVVPTAPPADRVSSAQPRTAPNWALKTAMAATGSLLALLLVIRLIMNCWFFAGSERFDAVSERVHTFLMPYLAYGAWLWIIRAVVLVLLVAHIAIAVVLVTRAKAGRGSYPAKLHSGWAARLTKLMPYTGIAIGLFAIVYVLDQIAHIFVPGPALYCFNVLNGPALCYSSSYDALAGSLAVPWLAVVYIVGLLAIGLHVLHGLATVATIAAGNGVRLGRLVTGWLVPIAGGVIGGLLLANLLIPIGILGGWF